MCVKYVWFLLWCTFYKVYTTYVLYCWIVEVKDQIKDEKLCLLLKSQSKIIPTLHVKDLGIYDLKILLFWNWLFDITVFTHMHIYFHQGRWGICFRARPPSFRQTGPACPTPHGSCKSPVFNTNRHETISFCPLRPAVSLLCVRKWI